MIFDVKKGSTVVKSCSMFTSLRRCLLFFLFILTVSGVWAQEYKYEIGAMAGGAFYMGDLNKTTPFKELNPSAGVVFRHNINFRVALKADLAWGRVSGSTSGLENKFPDDMQGSFTRNLIDLGGQLEFNFFPYSDKFPYKGTKRISPYMLVGLGLTLAPGDEFFVSPNIPIGFGVKYKMKNRVNIGCEFTVRKLFQDNLEASKSTNTFLDDPYKIGSSLTKNQDWYAFLSFFVTWDFGPRNRPCNNAESIF